MDPRLFHVGRREETECNIVSTEINEKKKGGNIMSYNSLKEGFIYGK